MAYWWAVLANFENNAATSSPKALVYLTENHLPKLHPEDEGKNSDLRREVAVGGDILPSLPIHRLKPRRSPSIPF